MKKGDKMQQIYEQMSRDVIDAGRDMAAAGLVAGTWGNISVRVPGGDLVLITPSGMPYHSLAVSDLVTVDLSGAPRAGHRRPSTELPLHLEIYRARPDVQAIMHTHSRYACALAVARLDLPPILEEQAQLAGGRVAVASYAPAGSEALAHHAVQALGSRNAVLLANHGLVGVGGNIQEAFLVCQIIEKACQIYILSRGLGQAHVLSNSEVRALQENFRAGYGQRKVEN